MSRITFAYTCAVLALVCSACNMHSKHEGSTDSLLVGKTITPENRNSIAEELDVPVAVVDSWGEAFPGVPILTAHTLVPDGDTICILSNDSGERQYSLQVKPDGSVIIRTIENPIAITELPAVVVDSFKNTFPGKDIDAASLLSINDEPQYDVLYFWKKENGLIFQRGIRMHADGRVAGRIYQQHRVDSE